MSVFTISDKGIEQVLETYNYMLNFWDNTNNMTGETKLKIEEVQEFLNTLNKSMGALISHMRREAVEGTSGKLKDTLVRDEFRDAEAAAAAAAAAALKARKSNAESTYFYDEPKKTSLLLKVDSTMEDSPINASALFDILSKIVSMKEDATIREYVKAYIAKNPLVDSRGAAITSKKGIDAAIDAAVSLIKTFQQSSKVESLFKKYQLNTPAKLLEIYRDLKSVLPYFTQPKSAPGASSGETVHAVGHAFLGGDGLIGGAKSYLEQINEIDSDIQNKRTELARLTTSSIGFAPLSTSDQIKKQALDDSINILETKKLEIKNKQSYLSKRTIATIKGPTSYKINENEYLINKAVEALKSNVKTHTIQLESGTPIPITSFADLRKYIINYTNDPITILLRLTNLNPINLDDILPKIIEDTLKITTNDKGILEINNTGDGKVEMPNPLGNKANREEYNKKFKANTCYGFGGTASSEFCVSLLNHCLASDKESVEKCRNLFASEDWSVLKDIGIQNTNIFLIKEFLLKIGYPRINDTFSGDIDSWFEVIKTRYDIAGNTPLLESIQQNDKLREVITDMVTKYNKIIKAQRSSRNSSSNSLKFHLPRKMKGGDNHSILNTNLYELNGGRNENLINFSSVSPSEKIYNIFKELVKDQNITTAYKNFFDKMQRNIENNNHNIDNEVVQQFNTLLHSFKESEGKLNKLLQTMHNFAWFLGKNVDSTNLSEEEKKLNTEANSKLSKMLNDETIQAYNTAREKLLTSLNNRSKKMIAIAASHPMILIAN